MGEAGRRYVADCYDIDASAEPLARLFGDVIEGGSARRPATDSPHGSVDDRRADRDAPSSTPVLAVDAVAR